MIISVKYNTLNNRQKKALREEYIREQNYKCFYCKEDLRQPPPKRITDLKINLTLFPPNFLGNPIHLQHNHTTDLTEGAVHAYCNAIMWEYEGR